MSRLGLAGRLTLFIAIAMLLMQLVSVAIYLSDRREAEPDRLRLPFPDRLEAMVLLFETAPPAEQSLLIRALGGSDLQIELGDPGAEDSPPPPSPDMPADHVLPGLGKWLSDYSATLGQRSIRISVPAEEAARALPGLRAALRPDRVRVSVQLNTGQWLHVQRQSSPGLTFGGLPVGLLSALLSTLFAGFAMLVVWTETRPLRRLAGAVERFARDLVPRPLAEPRAPDLRKLVRAINAMQSDIARVDQTRTDMIAALSHDIRTPLARLTLRLRKLDPELREAAERDIDQITRVAEDAFRFTEADLARLESPVDLRALLADLTREAGTDFTDQTRGPATLAHANATLLARAFANLIDNAAKYANGARVSLTAQRTGFTVLIEDDGPGIPPADRARLLEPFQRGNPERSGQVAGSGLGLPLARRIFLRHGGEMTIEDAPSGGLRLRITLPANSEGAAG